MTPTTNNVGPTTSATERLRALLDECGVEYDVRDGKTIKNTYWDDAEGRRWGYTSDESGVIKDRQLFLVRGRMDITPEQAIDATLGRGTCHNAAPSYLDFLCSECGFVHYHSDTNDTGDGNEWRYCPNCGRKVVDDELAAGKS